MWYLLQGIIITGVAGWLASIGGQGMAPVAFGVFAALLITGISARLIDAHKIGWKASRPPPITEAEKRGANLTVLKWGLMWAALLIAIYGAALWLPL